MTGLISFGVPLLRITGLCAIDIYVTYVCSFLNAWLVVVLTVERFISIRPPLRRTEICTAACAKEVLVSLTTVALIVYVPIFWLTRIEMGENTAMCRLNPEFMCLATIINHVDFVVTFTLPFLIIVTLIASIIFMV
jgi:hypothetical protein